MAGARIRTGHLLSLLFTLLQHGTEVALQQRQVLLCLVIGVPGMREHRDDGLRDIRKLPRAPHGDKLVPFRKICPAGHGELPHERPRPADLTEQLKKARRPAGIVQHIAVPLHAIGRNRRLPPRVSRRAAVVQPRIVQRTGPDVHIERHIQQEQALDRRTHGLLHGKQRPHGMRRDHDRLMPCAQLGKCLPGLLPPDRHGGRREIPRTAAMTWFGDLDISWLTELPGGRKPIRTVVVNEADAATMGRMFAHIRARVDAGERTYIVCPRIDADDEENEGGSGVSAAAGSALGRAAASGSSARTAAGGRATRAAADAIGIDDPYETFDENGETVARPPLHAVAEIADRLQKLPQFQGIRFATLTGRDKDDVKTQVMADFAGGETPILVSTTVIEVGVDVKQASCIVIFDADRYGLSQLHQLRGRVGRGGTNSWAFLISRAEPGSPAEQRLEVIHHSLAGAEIAQADLEFRGAGDVLGDAQSGGKSSLKLLRVVKDADMIADARTRAGQLLAADPELAGEVQLAGAVLDFTRGNETFLTSS